MKILTIVGARPQFIKAAAISRELANGQDHSEIIVHTGQHYDQNMSEVFFEELGIPEPGYNLEISGGRHGQMTGRMLEQIERVLLDENPDAVLIYGDTNSTLAGALAAAKLHIPVAHVEAGLRSFNMKMPEEINRILADRVSSWLFCPTDTAVMNLKNEGITKGVSNVGDVMYDVALYYRDKARHESNALDRFKLESGNYVLATCHRAENTDDSVRLKNICRGLSAIAEQLPVLLPLHPRTAKIINGFDDKQILDGVTVVHPLSFLDMVALEQASRAIVTDSGGVQKEAYFYGVPCITMRDETEWVETVELGWNQIVGADENRIVEAFKAALEEKPDTAASPYGDGQAAKKIVAELLSGVR